MREIKFRVWNIISKTMMSFSEIKRCADFAMADGLNSNDFIVLPLKNSILNQFTGLFDKNRIEIYGGDILFGREEGNGETTAWTDINVVVFFNDKYGKWQVRTKNIKENSCWCDDLCDFIEEYEVIGNIYEHPHLLEANHD